MTVRKTQILGVNFSTARARLERDLLFKLATDAGHRCHRCQEALTRDNFSVDHKVNWSTSPDPKAMFFDLENIAFSHHRCNCGFTSKTGTTKYPEYIGSRRSPAKIAGDARRVYSREKRHSQYLRTGN